LLAAKKIALHDQTLVRRLVLGDSKNTIAVAEARDPPQSRRTGRVSRQAVCPRRRIHLDAAPAAAFAQFAISERARQPIRRGRSLHERAFLSNRTDRARREDPA
jgi:hypothetical protein